MSLVRDGIAIAGLGLALYGVLQWSQPLAFVVGGLLLIGGSYYWATWRAGG